MIERRFVLWRLGSVVGFPCFLTHDKWQVTRTNRKWNGCNDYA